MSDMTSVGFNLFEYHAIKYRNHLLVYLLLVLLLIVVLIVSIDMVGSPKDFLENISISTLKLLLALSSLLLFMILILLWSWFSGYKIAARDSKNFDLDMMRKLHRDVIGPFPWK